jgi:tRNA pseudouridine38-40 synthase
MQRFFLEVSYDGTGFSGFQVQQNAVTIQWEVEKALGILLKEKIDCTGSSRTDAGVHALQNYFHFDFSGDIPTGLVYHLNAILPATISAKAIIPVATERHCRFHATSRVYRYDLHAIKDPFLVNRSWFYPYPLEYSLMQEAACIVQQTHDFTSFAKRNADVKTHLCAIYRSEWVKTAAGWSYHVEANRFLRGMVRGLVSTMLLVGRKKLDIKQFIGVIEGRNNQKAVFNAPGHGLYLVNVNYPVDFFPSSE